MDVPDESKEDHRPGNTADASFPEVRVLSITSLVPTNLRDLRTGNIDRIEQSMQSGYNPARPITVVAEKGKYLIADGHHRVIAAQRLRIEMIPAVIYPPGTNLVLIAVRSNEEETCFASMDVHDYLQIIDKLRKESKTEKEIAKILNWERDQVAKYVRVLHKIAPEAREYAKAHQPGRNDPSVPIGTLYEFTEGFFRNSGIYEVTDCQGKPSAKLQLRFLRWFCEEKQCRATNLEISTEISLLLPTGETDEPLPPPRKAKGNKKHLQDAQFGVDVNDGLRKLPDHWADVVITTLPEDTTFIRLSRSERLNPKGIPRMKYLDGTFREAKRVMRPNAHACVFFNIQEYQAVYELLSRHLIVDRIPLVWVDHHAGSQGSGRHQYECLFFCTNAVNRSRPVKWPFLSDVLEFNGSGPGGTKPTALLEYLIGCTTSTYQVVLDPFMRDGAVLQAAAKLRRSWVGFEREERYQPEFIRRMGKLGGSG